MASRRAFLAGLLASSAAPAISWADVGLPTHLSAAMCPDQSHVLTGLRADGTLAFTLPLPARGHAAAAHPSAPEAVAFARRPGTYAIVIDCARGIERARLDAPQGHHFYGHGAFSKDGTRLYTTEHHIESGAGRIGIWARDEGYARIGEIPSGGIGPHEILRLPGTDQLAVANGGIRTSPATGREKLNLSTMRPNLSIMTAEGKLIDQAELPTEFHQSSLRHIAAALDGTIACAFQWEGDPYASPPLLARYQPGNGLALLGASEAQIRALNSYAGSVAILPDGRIALTSPRGGVLQLFDANTGDIHQSKQSDICGVSKTHDGGLATDGLGGIHRIGANLTHLARHDLAFDNHLVAI